MAGIPNASSKMLGKTNNKINNIKATFAALESFHVKATRKKVTSARAVDTASADTPTPSSKTK
jgi:ribosomal protein S5